MEAINLFKLVGSIFVDNKEADKNIEGTTGKAETLRSKLGKGMKTAGKWGGALVGAAGLAGGALFGMAKKATDSTDRIDKLSQKIGISRKEFQEYEYILSQNGTEIEVLQRGMKTLTERMQESTEGTGKGAEAFERLKLDAIDPLTGSMKSQSDMFDEAARALMQMPEGAEKSRLAFDLFGKAGQELMPLLNGTEEDMDALREAANEMGLVLSDDAIDAGAQFQDSMDDVKRSLGAVTDNIGAELMPMFQTFLDWIIDHMPEIQKIIKLVFEKIGNFVKVAVDIFNTVLMPAFQAIYEWVEENWPAIQEIIKAVMDTIKKIIETVTKAIKKIWDKWGKDIKEFTKTTFNAIKTIVDTTIKVIRGIIDTVMALISGDWEGAWDGIKGILKSVWEGMAKLLPQLLELLFSVLRGAFTVFKDIGKDMFSMVWEGMKGIWGSISSWVGEKVSWLVDKLAFWKKSSDEMDDDPTPSQPKPRPQPGGIHGSHKSGLEYVPFNNYKANLHEGEGVLTKEENKEYQENKENTNQEVTIVTPLIIDGKEVTRITSKHQLQNNKGKARALGVVPS